MWKYVSGWYSGDPSPSQFHLSRAAIFAGALPANEHSSLPTAEALLAEIEASKLVPDFPPLLSNERTKAQILIHRLDHHVPIARGSSSGDGVVKQSAFPTALSSVKDTAATPTVESKQADPTRGFTSPSIVCMISQMYNPVLCDHRASGVRGHIVLVPG